ncbi:MAG: hypothetical protein H7Z13_00665 [Ferruginibacter sp.]|nr:hypothetical protein [Ferruginibacter sp.]
MDNFFIAKKPFVTKENSTIVKFLNKRLGLKFGYHIQPLPDPQRDMNNIEQRINYFHLLDGVITNKIAGDIVELGSFTGQCAMIFQKVIQLHGSDKKLHLYDSFETKFKIDGSVEEVLNSHFREAGLDLPVIHKGYFQATIPVQLPEKISFVHIDCGFGGDVLMHKELMLYCLKSVYPRMSKGAVCILMDYYVLGVNNLSDYNPGVKLAADEFLSGLPEKIISLYANQYSHAYFRKLN